MRDARFVDFKEPESGAEAGASELKAMLDAANALADALWDFYGDKKAGRIYGYKLNECLPTPEIQRAMHALMLASNSHIDEHSSNKDGDL
jgi:hypothetical protein